MKPILTIIIIATLMLFTACSIKEVVFVKGKILKVEYTTFKGHKASKVTWEEEKFISTDGFCYSGSRNKVWTFLGKVDSSLVNTHVEIEYRTLDPGMCLALLIKIHE